MWTFAFLAAAQLTSFDHNSTSLFGSIVAELTRLPITADRVRFHAVAFYAPSCPHCQEFAPAWERVAVRLQQGGGKSGSARPSVGFRLSAINCEGSTATQDLCVAQHIPDVPLIRAWVLTPHADLGKSGKREDGGGAATQAHPLTTLTLPPEELDADTKKYGTEEGAVLAWLLRSCTDEACGVPMPLRAALLAELRQQRQLQQQRAAAAATGAVGAAGLPGSEQYSDHNWNGAVQDDLQLRDAALFPEGGDELASRQADFGTFDNNGDGAVDATELCATWRRLGRNLTRSDCSTIIAAADASHSGTLNMTEFLAVEASAFDGSHSGHRFPELPASAKGGISPLQRLADVTFAVRYMLHHGVFAGTQVLSRARRSALVSWLLLLHRALPFAALRDDLRELLTAIRTDPEMARLAPWRAYLAAWSLGELEYDNKVVDTGYGNKVFHDSSSSQGCGSGRSHSNRFTCSLWVAFHVLAASCDGSKPGGRCPVQPRQIMHGIFLMVKWFFGCRECRDHFLAEYAACAHGRCAIDFGSKEAASRGVALWLWKAHNSVTLRLATQHRSNQHVRWRPDPLLRNLAFPSQAHCSSCWGSARHIGHRWDHKATHAFLRATYWDAAWDNDDNLGSSSSRTTAAAAVFSWSAAFMCAAAAVWKLLTLRLPKKRHTWLDASAFEHKHVT